MRSNLIPHARKLAHPLCVSLFLFYQENSRARLAHRIFEVFVELVPGRLKVQDQVADHRPWREQGALE